MLVNLGCWQHWGSLTIYLLACTLPPVCNKHDFIADLWDLGEINNIKGEKNWILMACYNYLHILLMLHFSELIL